MSSDPTILEQGYNFFLAEAPELLERIEQDLYNLTEDRSTAKIHNLMRAAHTIKGGAANVELDLIKDIAHSLESVFRVFYKPEVEIDSELYTLLLEGYECLRTPLNAEIFGSYIDPDEIKQRADHIFAKLEAKLGDFLNEEAYIPNSVELGFDIAESIFNIGVAQRLDEIEQCLQTGDSREIAQKLREQGEVFIGLGESLGLPGFCAIAQTTLSALENAPDQVIKIAEVALANLRAGREAVLAGDREQGGEVSSHLQSLANPSISDFQGSLSLVNPPADTAPFKEELVALELFLDQKKLPQNVVQTYLETIHFILGWFHLHQNIPQNSLSFSTLIPQTLDLRDQLNYLQTWLKEVFSDLKQKRDRQNLIFFRQVNILASILAVAKFQYINSETEQQVVVINALDRQFQKLIKVARKYPASSSEKQWLTESNLEKYFIEPETIVEEEIEAEGNLLDTIWGSATAETETENIFVSQDEEDLTAEDYSLVKSEATAVENTQPQPLAQESAEVLETHPAATTPKAKTRQYIRVDLEGLERLNHLSGELLINHNRQSLQEVQLKQAVQKLFSNLQRHHKTLNQLQEWSEVQGKNLGLPSFEGTVELSKFDSLEMDQYSELHLQLHTALDDLFQLQEAAESLDVVVHQNNQSLEKQQRLLANVRDDLLDARMMPLGNIINRFSQMVERMALAYGKKVEFKLHGTDVLIDKAIAEKLYEPLLHLVRNAFDHGIELPEARRQQGKPEKGLIAINAYYQGSQAIIEVRDDGKGLNLEKIISRANEMDLLPTQQKALTSSEEDSQDVLDVLFQPGFSTAQEVSEISGRGIGLNIVRSQLQALKGSVTVQSSPQRGTTFVLQIPFSMTTAKLLVVQAGEAVYALLLDTIERVLLPQPDQFKQLEGKKVLHWNFGKEKAVISVRQLQSLVEYYSPLNSNLRKNSSLPKIPGQDMSQDDLGQNPVCLIKSDGEWRGLEVDAVLGDQEMVIRPLGNAIAPPKYVCGCSILGDGNLILVIDGAVFFQGEDAQRATELVLPSKPTPEKLAGKTQASLPPSRHQLKSSSPLKQIMVVDDAVSLRQTLSLTLEKAGYQVIQAQDGLEALEKLKRNKDIGAVICDIEMPRMNGFEFLSQIHQDPALAHIPVAMLTSRSAGKHRQLAEELGADAYFTKPFIEKELLQTMSNFMRQEALEQTGGV